MFRQEIRVNIYLFSLVKISYIKICRQYWLWYFIFEISKIEWEHIVQTLFHQTRMQNC